MARRPKKELLKKKQLLFKTIKQVEKKDSKIVRRFILCPLDDPEYVIQPTDIPVPGISNFEIIQDYWKKTLGDILASSAISFRGLTDETSNLVRTRKEAVEVWLGHWDLGMEALNVWVEDGFLTKEDVFRVVGVVRKVTKIIIENLPITKSLYTRHDIRHLKRILNGSKKAVYESCVGGEPIFNKVIRKTTGGIARTVIKFLDRTDLGNAEVIRFKARAQLKRLEEERRSYPLLKHKIRNYLTQMEYVLFHYLREHIDQSVPDEEIIEAVLKLFAGHGVEKTMDADSWVRTLREQSKTGILQGIEKIKNLSNFLKSLEKYDPLNPPS